MSNGQYLHCVARLSEQDVVRKSLESYSTNVWLFFYRVAMRVRTNYSHDTFKIRQVGRTKTGLFSLIKRNRLKMLSLRVWMEEVVHLRSA